MTTDPTPTETLISHVSGGTLEMYVDDEGDLRIEIDHEAAGYYHPGDVVQALINIGVISPEQALAHKWAGMLPQLTQLIESVEQLVAGAKGREESGF